MHTQRKAKGKGGSSDRNPTVAEVAVLRLLSEQGAIPLDQMSRFLSRSERETAGILNGLRDDGWIKLQCLLADQPLWAWLTGKGERFLERPRHNRRLGVQFLAHYRAVNEIRLHLESREPAGRWISEGELHRWLEPEVAKADGVFEVGGERHAIEVELSRKARSSVEKAIASHSLRYDAVIYFCARRTLSQLEEIRQCRSWPKLVIRPFPKSDPIYETNGRGFGFPLRPQVGGRRGRGTRKVIAPWERRVLRLVSEHGALPLDQLGCFLGHDSDAERLARHLVAGKLARQGTLLPDEPDWLWLTTYGNRMSETGLCGAIPSVGGLAKMRALAAVRLQIEAKSPTAVWTGRRVLRSRLSGRLQIPDAVVELGGERHAIEVEIRQRNEVEAVELLSHRSRHYDAVVCFCDSRREGFYKRLQRNHHFPKLVIRPLPTPSSTPSLPPSRWEASLAYEEGAPEEEPTSRARYKRRIAWQSTENPSRTEVPDDLWVKIEPLLPGDQRRVIRARRLPDRAALSGVVWVARRGGGWQQLPVELGFGSPSPVLSRLRGWEETGVWPSVQRLLEEGLPDGRDIRWSALEPYDGVSRFQ